jgi:hypothetical protein
MSRRRILDESAVEKAAGAPITIKALAVGLTGSSAQSAVENVETVVRALVRKRRLHEYPPERKGAASRFAVRAPSDWVGERILEAVKSDGGKAAQGSVRKSLKKWEAKLYDKALGDLVKSGRLHSLTLRYKFLMIRKPTPFDHLLPGQVTALKTILERINRHRPEALDLMRLRAFLDGSPDTRAETSFVPTDELLAEWYSQDLPRLGGATATPIPWTWKRGEEWCRAHGYKLDPDAFLSRLSDLFKARRVDFIPHSHPHEIPADERKLTVPSPMGEVFYYWRWR